MSNLPPATGKTAIILGFVQGTWLLVDGIHRYVAGDYIRVFGRQGPWAVFVKMWGFDPMALGWLIALSGVVWMVIANWYLFQNSRSSWQAMLILIVFGSWYVGPVTLVNLAQLLLLLLPSTRRALRA